MAGGEVSAGSKVSAADQLSFVKCLGKGFFGEVWQAHDNDQRAFAVKKVRLALISEHTLLDELQREIDTLYQLQHPRILQLHFDFRDVQYMYLGMEFSVGGSLLDKLNAAKKFSNEVAARYFLETCEALDYLHHREPEKVIHRDVKPENIFLDADDHTKLADFGWASLLEGSKRDTVIGTLDYLPPEVIMGSGHDENSDMWNMGVLLYELCTGQSPFGAESKELTCRIILAVDLRFKADHDPDSRDLITKLCKKAPQERLKVREAMTHCFVTKYCLETSSSSSAIVVPAGDDETAQCLRKELDNMTVEKQHLDHATQQTERDLQEVIKELEAARAELEAVRAQAESVESACADVAAANKAREAELANLRPPPDFNAPQSPTACAVGGWFARRRTGTKNTDQ